MQCHITRCSYIRYSSLSWVVSIEMHVSANCSIVDAQNCIRTISAALICSPLSTQPIGMQSKVDRGMHCARGMTKRLLHSPFPMHHNVVRFYDYIPRILTYAATWAAERKQWKVVWKSWILIQQREGCLRCSAGIPTHYAEGSPVYSVLCHPQIFYTCLGMSLCWTEYLF